MTWTANFQGHDTMPSEKKERFERDLVLDLKDFISELSQMEGVVVSVATVSTNTTGTMDIRETNA